MSTVTTARSAAVHPEESSAWHERSARLYEELRRPARAMIRRAFRGAFTDDEIEDVYSNAWLGTLRALAQRHERLNDEEIRKYVLTAVAHHASKELRRRKRRPVAPLDGIHAVPDDGVPTDESAAKREESRVARDLLSSLPPRRRAVMLLRYGWGLEPNQVCRLIKGLSPRAYRKEITRGVDELAQKLRLVQNGEWCADRESLLKAYAAGIADEEQRLQAQQHLSHCRHCSEFVGRLSGHLHDIGGAVAIPSAAEALGDGRFSVVDRVVELGHRIRDSGSSVLGRTSSDGTQESSSQALSLSGGARGAGAAGTGVLAKLAGAGTASKLTAMCLSGGIAASACLATGVVPAHLPGLGGGGLGPDKTAPVVKPVGHGTNVQTARLGSPPGVTYSTTPEPAPDPPGDTTTTPSQPPPTTATTTPTTTTSTTPIAPTAPPTDQEFDVAAAAPTSSGSSSSSGGSGGGGGSAVNQEFGP